MLSVYKKLHQLRFGELMEVYRESVAENGEEFYPHLSANEQIIQAQQDFYAYLQQGFFTKETDTYCIWEENGRYICALRLESYQDGLLLEALETRPEYRKQGYAQKLITEVQRLIGKEKIYSHISHKNTASLAVHQKCGFEKIQDYARYADGSVNDRCGTYLYQSKTQAG